uniref:Uncharacterized protein n=1 Tax=Kalanchoe fedtschenkoi TaxID=63787 RepID=A0A7N0TD94_KALFE
MDVLLRSRFVFLAIICAAAFHGMEAATVVSGNVFCDQCRDGQLSLFDYPLSGIKVAVACPGSDGQATVVGEETTNWFGSYSVKFDGTPELSSCFVQVTGSDGDTHNCAASAGPAQRLRALFKMFNYAFYSVDSLLSQPAQPMSFCPRAPTPPTPSPVPDPVTPVIPLPPTVTFPPPVTPVPVIPPPPVTPINPPPPIYTLPPVSGLPPMPHLPPMPPAPYTEASACPYQSWTMPQYRCYWRAVNPDTKVALVFGPVAAERYGTDVTMWQSLQGRGDPYRTLLREGTTAYLNSLNSLQFPYNTIAVVAHMNSALLGSQNQVLLTALRFIRANGGYNGNTPCKFTPCN